MSKNDRRAADEAARPQDAASRPKYRERLVTLEECIAIGEATEDYDVQSRQSPSIEPPFAGGFRRGVQWAERSLKAKLAVLVGDAPNVEEHTALDGAMRELFGEEP